MTMSTTQSDLMKENIIFLDIINARC